MKNIMRIFIINVMLCSNLIAYAPNEVDNSDKVIEEIQLKIKKQKIYNLVILEIKKAESLKLKAYICPAGHITIGYGHALLPGETFTEITERQADSLLIVDFDKRLKYVPEMAYNKRLAIAKFIFNCGIGMYNKSALKRRIMEQKTIDDLIIRYCHYKKKGKYVKSNWLLQQRIFELMIYNGRGMNSSDNNAQKIKK